MPLRKGALYKGPVDDLAIELIREVVAKASDPSFEPLPLDDGRADVPSPSSSFEASA
jgi:putative two-component system hydrogenase maturation factor HypX/HoxX